MRASSRWSKVAFPAKKVLEMSMKLGVKIKIKANMKLRFVSTNIANALSLLKEIALSASNFQR